MCTLVYVLNKTPSSALPNSNITPHEAWFGVKPNVSNLRIFGSLAYVHVQKDKRGSSLGSHMEKCIFLGYPEGYKGWRFYNPVSKRIIISERAMFDERYQPGLKDWNASMSSLSLPPSSLRIPPTSDSSSTLEHPTTDYVTIPPLVVPSDAPASHLEGENAPPAALVNIQDEQAVPPEEPKDQLPPQPQLNQVPLPAAPPIAPERAAAPLQSAQPPAASTSHPVQQKATRGRSRAPKQHLEPTRRSTRPHNPPTEWWKAPQYQPHSSRSPAPSAESVPQPEPTPEQEQEEHEPPPMEDTDLDEFATAEVSRRVHSGQTLPDPVSLKQALKRDDATQWQSAADAEIQAHFTNGTWKPCKLPPGRTAIGCKWVLLQKFLADGSIDRYKARLVAKGYSQRSGFDYTETFAPTVRMATIRTILALSAVEDLHLRSIDISHAFINGDLEEEIYMEQPEGYHFEEPGDVLRLCKSLYGLKQAGRS